MTHRAPTVLLAALGTACASTTGFNEIPLSGRIALLVVACVFVGALQMLPGPTAVTSQKNVFKRLTFA